MGLPVDFPVPGPSTPGEDPAADAATAWSAIARLFLSQQDEREKIAADLGLTLTELFPLFHLVADHGTSQRDLATLWSCDPSWVTNRIDRLEELGLAERRVSPTDRRVKEVWLTTDGNGRRAKAMHAFAEAPAALADLPAEDLADLARILAKLDLGDGPAGPFAR